LGIKRSIVPVGRVSRGSNLEWNTDKLFAKSGRKDLVGHLEDSVNPGERGNMVLVGHNYNRGAYNWTGVFHSIHRLKKGDVIVVISASDKEYRYRVERVEKVPRKHTLKHITRLGPSQDEQLTLATCGGANIAPFPAVTYVTASRILPGD
jgi:LPXTG-site transpeptidase (sortase) family protein